MKKLFALAVLLVIALTSCKKKDYAEFELWTGDWTSLKDIKPDEPILFVWVKPFGAHPPGRWYQYKRFYENPELIEVKRGIMSPEKEELNPNLQGEKLLAFFMGRDLKVGLKVMSFRLDDETKEFVCPKGRDKVLYKLFTEKQPPENFYGPDANELKFIEEQRKMEQEIIKLYRENGDPNEIRRLKEEWWGKIESRLKLYLKKYPWREHPWGNSDSNEIRRKNEEGWKNMEEIIKRSRENADQNLPATN
jgi:hypothetical protein